VPEARTGRKRERTTGPAAEKPAGKRHGKKDDSKKAPAKKAAARKAAQPGATVIDIGEARLRASGGRA